MTSAKDNNIKKNQAIKKQLMTVLQRVELVPLKSQHKIFTDPFEIFSFHLEKPKS